MAAFKLTGKQWDALDELRFSTRDAKVFRNATVILLSAGGNSKPMIAYELGCSLSTVDNVRRHYREQGLAGLVPRTSPGRRSRATLEYRDALRKAVQTPPQSLGFGFSVWSLARLAAYLKRETGVSLSEDQLGRVIRAEGFSYQRPKHTMKGKRDELAYERARRQLKTLKKKPSNPTPTKCRSFKTKSKSTVIRRWRDNGRRWADSPKCRRQDRTKRKWSTAASTIAPEN